MRAEHHPHSDLPYWHLHQELGEAEFAGRWLPVQLKTHVSHERYTEPASINPVGLAAGERTHLLAHLYLNVPDLRLTIESSGLPATTGIIGTVTGIAESGEREERIGSGQAWYYLAAQTVVLWELLLDRSYRADDLRMDHTLRSLWQHFERFLIGQFPDTAQIVTPSWEPEYDTTRWQHFLSTLGYLPSPTDEQAWYKLR